MLVTYLLTVQPCQTPAFLIIKKNCSNVFIFWFQVLKRYPCLWGLERVKHQRPKLYIVNLQWTPKDESATLKINGELRWASITQVKIDRPVTGLEPITDPF